MSLAVAGSSPSDRLGESQRVTVYVDDMYRYSMGRYGRMKMSHMAADTSTELLEMADRIGVGRRWMQDRGERYEHFDISKTKRSLAVEAGAVEVTLRQMSFWLTNGKRGAPTDYDSRGRLRIHRPQ